LKRLERAALEFTSDVGENSPDEAAMRVSVEFENVNMNLRNASTRPDQHSSSIVADAVCAGCGCLCDDIIVHTERNRVTQAERACELGRRWFLQSPIDGPSCRIGGEPAELQDGINRAAGILVAANYPLIFGFEHASCEAQRCAVAIGDWSGGTVDPGSDSSKSLLGASFQGIGEVTCTLGEMANRGDLIVCWGADPDVTHPRHFSRYSLQPQGMFLPRGRQDRTCVVIDSERTQSAAQADLFIQVAPDRHFESLWILRALLKGIELNAADVETDTGVPLAAWLDLLARMRKARYGVVLYGDRLNSARGKQMNADALLGLVSDLNAFTRCVASRVHGHGNTAGAAGVLTWQTGYPFGVNFSRGYPRFNPGEYTAGKILARKEADAALIVAADPLSQLNAAACAHLRSIPTVAVDFRETLTTRAATVSFCASIYGIHTSGTAFRMDDVPLRLRPTLQSERPSDVEILSRIERRIQELAAENLALASVR